MPYPVSGYKTSGLLYHQVQRRADHLQDWQGLLGDSSAQERELTAQDRCGGKGFTAAHNESPFLSYNSLKFVGWQIESKNRDWSISPFCFFLNSHFALNLID